ncbi:alkaline phosphatase family protein [Streptomyces sp. NPDC059373]
MTVTAAAKVLVVGMDGVRFDRLTEFRPPVLHGLMASGAYGTSLLPYGVPGDADGVTGVAYSDSGPGWSTVVTGVWPDKHGVTDNGFASPDYARYPDFLTRAKSVRPGLATAAVVSWGHLARYGTLGARIDARVHFDGDRDGYADCDRLVVETAERWLGPGGHDPDAVFVYFGSTDEVAHEVGPLGEDYRDALLRQDGYLGRLLDTIRARESFPDERWTVLVTTDHGHLDGGGHGGVTDAEREVFVVLAEVDGHLGEHVPGLDNPRLVDIAPTVLHRLGIPIEPAWGLDGVPLPGPGAPPGTRTGSARAGSPG